MIDSNNDEWGNIELPGLSDEKLLKTNWNMVTAIAERSQNPKWIANQAVGQAKREANPKWHKNRIDAIKTNNASDEWKELNAAGAEKRKQNPDLIQNLKKGAAKREQNKEFREARNARNRVNAKDPVLKAKHQQSVIDRNQDPEYQRKLQASILEKLLKKGFIVCPAGVYLRQTEAAAALNISLGTLQKRIRDKQYYYISVEEYIMLTGQEPQ